MVLRFITNKKRSGVKAESTDSEINGPPVVGSSCRIEDPFCMPREGFEVGLIFIAYANPLLIGSRKGIERDECKYHEYDYTNSQR
jgi:hypothetical protein